MPEVLKSERVFQNPLTLTVHLCYNGCVVIKRDGLLVPGAAKCED